MKVVWLSLGYLCHSGRGVDRNGELTIPVISGELASPDQIHRALEPAWRSLVEERNDAGLVGPKDEGKPQPPLSAEEAAFQYERVQKGEVDSARLLLVFGMVPSVRHVDNDTIGFLAEDRDRAIGNGDQAVERMDDEDWRHAPAILDANTRYADGSTALHMAATFSLLRSVRHFLKAGADVNTTSNMGLQPIHNAAIMGHSAAVELLVRHKADVNARHRFAGSTPLHFAAEMGHHQLVRSLCELGADVEAEKRHGGTAIHVSADTNNAAVTRALIEAPCGADPDAALLGDTVPLYLAAGRGFHEVIDVLIEAGANPDRTLWPQRPWHSKNKKSRKATPATETKELTVTAQVLPGSDPSAAGWEEGNGATSLHNACENGHLKAVLALLEGGARQLATMQGVTPLITSLQYRHPKIAVALLDSTTPANVAVASPADGQTALHLAAAYDFPEVVARILMSFGGRTDVRDHQGNVALDYARGRLTRWLLGRFQGRDPELDAVVRSASPNELEHLLSATAASPEVQEL
ncbi:unnamed protein product [Polarella glacialis]|uniref:Uncharacterized protein n=1 Tax=Polarella glacialis TaxID=89957 RepID=A0A813JSF9_POLGL|nr:unnamed protein product [Polarella glacialis]